MRNFIVVGAAKAMVVQALLAIHTYTDARCAVVCARGTRFLRFSNLCFAYLEADLSGPDDDSLVDSINRFADVMPDPVLISADCDGARMVNRVRDRLAVVVAPTPDSSMLDCLDNKWRFYQFCRKHGLNVPATRLIGNKRDLDFGALSFQLGIPFVVKPVNQDSSRGIHIISSEEDYQREILDNDTYLHAPLIAQRYIPGTDVGLNLLSIKGRVAAIAIQQRIDPKHDGSEIRFFHNDYLESVAYTVSRECAYDGVMNIDARIEHGTGKVFLFESNPRVWRSLSASVWCGLNFIAASVEPAGNIRLLTSGSADIYYHPLFRPSLWRHALFDRGHRGRMVRLMTFDVCTLSTSIRILFAEGGWRRRKGTVSAARRAAA